MSPRFTSRQWPYILTIVLLALILMGLLQAFVIMWTHSKECLGDLAQGVPNVPDLQLCLRYHLGTTSEWLNARLAGAVGLVGIPTAWLLWRGHRIVRTDGPYFSTGKRASIRFAYSSTVRGLLGISGLVLLFIVFIYTDGLQW